jgi:hypothetical protein
MTDIDTTEGRSVYSLKLDKKRNFSVCVPPENGAHYEQGGFYFDQHGDLVTHPDLLDDAAKERLAMTERRARADRAAAAARRKALLEEGASEEEVAEAEKAGALDPLAQPNAVDVVRWANNAARYPFFQLKKAFRDQFGVNVATAEEAKNWLKNNGYLESLAPKDPLEHIGARTIQNPNAA